MDIPQEDFSQYYLRYFSEGPGPYQGYLDPGVPTVAELLRSEGYRTYLVGKWHVGWHEDHWPRRRGFDRFFGLIGGQSSYFGADTGRPLAAIMVNDDSPWAVPEHGYYATDAYSDKAVEYLRQHLREHPDRPFFLYLAYTAPHFPLQAEEADIARYDSTYDAGWEIVRNNRIQRQAALGLIEEAAKSAPRPANVPAWHDVEDQELWVRRMQVYAAMVDTMDEGIGRVIASLDNAGLLRNTLVLFLSDNGPASELGIDRHRQEPGAIVGSPGAFSGGGAPWAWVSAAPFRGHKADPYEGGVRAPFIAFWPQGIQPSGSSSNEPTHVLDIVPTLLRAGGVNATAGERRDSLDELPGRDLSSLFIPGLEQPRRSFYMEHFDRRAFYDGDWKAVFHPDTGHWQLYDLAHDPAEQDDLSQSASGRLSKMVDSWTRWAEGMGVRIH